ncbi:hypothetical protein JCM10207_005538 [Rhodosporidiobolus poonsookiae]
MATESTTNLLISLFHPFPNTLSLSLPSSTPLSSLSGLLTPYALPPSQSLSYASGRSLPSSSTPVASLAGARDGFVALRLAVRLPGGKGGFASQLRAQGGRMSSNKAQNTDSCRGLDGRRLSTMKEAQKLAKLLESEPDRLAAAALAKQQKLDELNAEIARLERQAGVEPSSAPVASTSSSSASAAGAEKDGDVQGKGQGGVKRRLDDQKYVDQSREIVGNVKDAVRAAMLKKRKKAKTSPPAADSGVAAKENAAPADGAEVEAAEVKSKSKGKGKGKAVEVVEEGEGAGEVEAST